MFERLAREEDSSSILPKTLKNVESRKVAGAFESNSEANALDGSLADGPKRPAMMEFDGREG